MDRPLAVAVHPGEIVRRPVRVVQVDLIQSGSRRSNRHVEGSTIIALRFQQTVTGPMVGVIMSRQDDIDLVGCQQSFDIVSHPQRDGILWPNRFRFVQGTMGFHDNPRSENTIGRLYAPPAEKEDAVVDCERNAVRGRESGGV